MAFAHENLAVARPVRLVEAARERPLITQVLRMIWTGGELSRADIAEKLGLSRSTVSGIVGELIDAGLVTEVGTGVSRGGRKPIVLKFRYDAFALVGVDLGATHVGVVLTDLSCKVLSWEEKAHPVRTDPAGTRKLVNELVARAISRWNGPARHVVGIGVAVPTPVDPRHPDHFSEVVLPAWKGEGIADTLRQKFKLPVFIDNDANLGALAESWWGASRGVADSVYIKVATGIGAGHIIGGRIYRGASGTAGEIGHLAMDPNGPVCVCGLRGCLTTLIGSEALFARVKALRAKHPRTSLKTKVTVDSLVAEALAGDELARAVVKELADHLGTAVAGMMNLLNPAVVAIGGSLARLGELLLAPLRETVRSRTLVSSVAAARIVASELGERDVAIGAATLVLEAALEDPARFPVSVSA